MRGGPGEAGRSGPAAGYKRRRRRQQQQRIGGGETSAMQSAVFLALQHGGGRAERGSRRRGEAEEAERGRMKRTM